MISFSSASFNCPKPGPPRSLSKKMAHSPFSLTLCLERVTNALILGSRDPHGEGEDEVERFDLLAAELLDPVEPLLEFRLCGEIPRHRHPPHAHESAPTPLEPLDAWPGSPERPKLLDGVAGFHEAGPARTDPVLGTVGV